MFALFSRILKLSGRYKGRIQGAFVCAFLESILSKMPIFLAFVILSGFAAGTLTGQTCLYVGIGLAAAVLVQMLVHYLSDSLQSAAGYLMFADKRMELGGHLRKLPMGYFTSGNIGKISSVLSTDMVFIEEVAMSTLGNMMSYLLSSLVLLAFMFYLNWQLGLIAAIVTILAWLVSKGMNKVSLREAAGRQEQSERLTDAVLSFVEGIGVIKSYNLLGEKSEELTGNFRRSRNTSLAFERKMTPWTMGLNILYGIGIAAIFGLAIFLEQNGGLSLAYVLGVLLFVFDLFGPLKALYGEASRLTVMNAALDRIEAVLDEPELPDTGKQHFLDLFQDRRYILHGIYGRHINAKFICNIFAIDEHWSKSKRFICGNAIQFSVYLAGIQELVPKKSFGLRCAAVNQIADVIAHIGRDAVAKVAKRLININLFTALQGKANFIYIVCNRDGLQCNLRTNLLASDLVDFFLNYVQILFSRNVIECRVSIGDLIIAAIPGCRS